MWYFTWILGVLLTCSFGITNTLDCLDDDPADD
ncbi:MAG TPA: cytochrome bd-I oxidase subunit CydX [Candidatus Competibacter sp.]|nr:cytochrome bd-I oxidase subunit CydX [Candidatus Competibacteraceae bacterium]HRW67287.1 cytochrome bd-I oxidase subunit CydX [Candidatus Competibacter sp.]